jgi:hypothetical protein
MPKTDDTDDFYNYSGRPMPADSGPRHRTDPVSPKLLAKTSATVGGKPVTAQEFNELIFSN